MKIIRQPVPDGHYILRREDTYRENILTHPSLRLSEMTDEARETNIIPNVEDFLWIRDGDSVEFPREIGSSIEQGSLEKELIF